MTSAPAISFVIPVYNKADILPEVVRALAAQVLPAAAEYIFIDDASTDGSPELLRRLVAALPQAAVLANAENAGPSIRLNQGAAAAAGQYLCLLDADEMIAPNAVAVMLRLLRQTGAQMVHGKIADVDRPAAQLVPPAIPEAPDYAVLAPPLGAMLAGRGFVRMSWLIETALFRRAGGCDPRIFIQDEALPLRLAAAAERMVDLKTVTGYAPAAASRLSANKAQQHHDRFFAAYNLLQDRPELSAAIRTALARKCLSAAWKAVRAGLLRDGRVGISLSYAADRAGLSGASSRRLARIADAFAHIDGVRRTVPLATKAATP